MSMGLAVIAAPLGAGEAAVRALLDACRSPGPHTDGELDPRIVAFYEQLRAAYPDHPPYPTDSPWSSMPLDTGIDHIFLTIRWSADDQVLDLIQQLAASHGLVLHDPQDDTVYLPPG